MKTIIVIGEEAEGETSVSSVFTLCNSAIGAGVLSLPFAFGCAGVTAQSPVACAKAVSAVAVCFSVAEAALWRPVCTLHLVSLLPAAVVLGIKLSRLLPTKSVCWDRHCWVHTALCCSGSV